MPQHDEVRLPGFYWYADPGSLGVVIAEVGPTDTVPGLFVQLPRADVCRPISDFEGDFRGPVLIEMGDGCARTAPEGGWIKSGSD